MAKIQKHSALLLITLALVLFSALAAQAAAPNLMAAFLVKGKVGLKWSTVDGVTEYLVFRKGPDGDFVQIATTTEGHYFDESIEGGTTYSYKIAIVEGGTNVFSGEKSVTTAKSAGSFDAPKWSGVRVESDRVMLSWDKVPGAIAYNIWRSETSGGPYEVVGTSQSHRYADNSSLVQGVTYYYVISALNEEFDETPQSEEYATQFGLTTEEREALQGKADKIELVPFVITELFLIDSNFEGRPLEQPADLDINSKGDIYVLNTLMGAVECYNSQGESKFSFGQRAFDKNDPADGEFVLPLSIAIDDQDQVYVGDVTRNDIQVFDAGGQYRRTILVNTTADQLALRPNGIDVLSDGRLVMTDSGNHRWLVTSDLGNILLEVGGAGGEEGLFSFPDQILATADGTVLVVDAINARVQVFDLEGNFIRAFGESGQGAGQFGRPKGIGMDEEGYVWVTDGMSNLIQRFTLEGEVKSVLGANDQEIRFGSPRGIKFVDGKLLMVERLQNRVTVFSIGS